MTGEKHKPIIGISMGDPTGIGPEIIVRACLGRACTSFASRSSSVMPV